MIQFDEWLEERLPGLVGSAHRACVSLVSICLLTVSQFSSPPFSSFFSLHVRDRLLLSSRPCSSSLLFVIAFIFFSSLHLDSPSSFPTLRHQSKQLSILTCNMGVDVPVSRDDYRRQVRQEGNKFTHLSNLENPRSGSDWEYADILTFRVLLKMSDVAKSDNEYPSFLSTHLKEARNRLGVLDDFRSLITIIQGKKWNSLPRAEVRRGKESGSFLGCLDQAVEQERLSRAPSAPERERRNTEPVRYAPLPDEEDEVSSSDSSHTSDVSHEDQTTINRQIKSEFLINSLILDYLQLLELYISDPKDQRKPRLEWSKNPENFEFPIPNSSTLSTRNDGGLIYRSCTNGKWARARPLSCYCSVEVSTSGLTSPQVSLLNGFLQAKSAFHIDGKKTETYAQESSQIIGMIHQRERNVRELGPEARVHPGYVPPQCPTWTLLILKATGSCPSFPSLNTGST